MDFQTPAKLFIIHGHSRANNRFALRYLCRLSIHFIRYIRFILSELNWSECLALAQLLVRLSVEKYICIFVRLSVKLSYRAINSADTIIIAAIPVAIRTLDYRIIMTAADAAGLTLVTYMLR